MWAQHHTLSTMIPHMKTGLLWDSTTSPEVEVVKTKLLALVFLLVKKAAMSAAVFCRHQNLVEVEVDHVKRALKYESMRFFDSSNLEEETDALIREMDLGSGLTDDDMMHALDSVVDEVEEEVVHERPREHCVCDVCHGIEHVLTLWEAFEPDDPAKAFLKEQLDYVDATFEQDEQDEI